MIATSTPTTPAAAAARDVDEVFDEWMASHKWTKSVHPNCKFHMRIAFREATRIASAPIRAQAAATKAVSEKGEKDIG